MIINNIRLAWQSIKAAKLRHVFTMLGVIVGVASIVLTVGLAEGVRQQVRRQIDAYGKELVIILPGRRVARDKAGNIVDLNFLSSAPTSILTNSDYEAVKDASGVQVAVPLSVINGVASYDGKPANNATVVATTSDLPALLNRKVAFGQFLDQDDEGRNFAVVGRQVAEEVFNENVPIGRSLSFRGEVFIVKGIFEQFEGTPLPGGLDFNNAIFIPHITGQVVSNETAPIFQIMARAQEPNRVDAVKANIERSLQKSRSGSTDFTVLKQEETLTVTSSLMTMLTTMVGAIGVVSLVVGGIGIMNVMLVSVTERTHEIGVRKAIGATNRQILLLFLTEAVILTVVGSILGIIVALGTTVGLRVLTHLNPVVTWPVAAIAIGAALFIGLVFGVLPANKAARKDAITALRNE